MVFFSFFPILFLFAQLEGGDLSGDGCGGVEWWRVVVVQLGGAGGGSRVLKGDGGPEGRGLVGASQR